MPGEKFKITMLACVFCVLIAFPIFNSLTGLVKDSENLEKRKMAAMPVFDVQLLDPFPAKFEKYYNDHFALRSLMVKQFTAFKLLAFKKSPFPDQVIIGNKGWLFMDRYTYQGTNRFTPKELEEFRLELEYRKNFVEKLGGKFYFALAPAKTIIYSDQMPYTFYRYTTQSWADQLQAYLNKHSSVKMLNLTDTLLAHKNRHPQLYYKLDTHWNGLGAFYAASAFCNLAAMDLHGIKPLSMSNYTVKTSPKTDGNCIQVIGFSNLFSDTDFELVPVKSTETVKVENRNYNFVERYQPVNFQTWQRTTDQKPKLIVSGDSFSNWFLPYVTESFGSTISVFDHWRYVFNEDLIQTEKPDAYLLLIHEPLMRELLKHQARLGQYGQKNK